MGLTPQHAEAGFNQGNSPHKSKVKEQIERSKTEVKGLKPPCLSCKHIWNCPCFKQTNLYEAIRHLLVADSALIKELRRGGKETYQRLTIEIQKRSRYAAEDLEKLPFALLPQRDNFIEMKCNFYGENVEPFWQGRGPSKVVHGNVSQLVLAWYGDLGVRLGRLTKDGSVEWLLGFLEYDLAQDVQLLDELQKIFSMAKRTRGLPLFKG